MGQEIRELDPTTVERIAAGEVVERPASVVKELVENSLDADASRVRVSVEAGGTEEIRVSDDGVGMAEADVRRAVRQHTTSKISDIDDLEGGVATLGFRGEALHAIGAVSRLTITTRPLGSARGTELRVEGGDVTAVQAAGCPEGTTVAVEDLFYNVPARRKYLKTTATEFGHVNTVVTAYALANPDVAVELEHDGRETFATTGSGSLRETVMAVYGRAVAESMLDVRPADVPEGPLESVSGLVSHPETTRSSREYLSTYVNGRYVTASTVREAVVDAYGGQLGPDRYPFAVLFVKLPAERVDVNVHPRKLEVRFADSEAVADQVAGAVEAALLREGLVRSGAPRGKSAPEETEVDPAGPTAEDAAEGAVDAGTDPAGDDTDTGGAKTGPGGGDPRVADAGSDPDAGDTGPAEAECRTETGDAAPVDAGHGPTGATGSPGERDEHRGRTGGRSRPAAARSAGEEREAGGSVTATEQRRFGEGDPTAAEFETLPSLRVLGQVDETYVVTATDDGLVVIDQHAADERVNYERLREQFAGETPTQALAEPVRVSVTAGEAELFETVTGALARLGFQADRADDRTIEVRTVPALLAEAGGADLVRDVLSSYAEGEGAAAATVEAAADELLADLACYPSITANTSLTEGSILSLLEALDDCENPYACPHGRPILIEIDADELAARFERDYPGHRYTGRQKP